MNIYLIGFMGAGKTTLGKKYAQHIGYKFVDLDVMFEEITGTSIPQYFTERGEEGFREKEREILHGTAGYDVPCVIATGGGVPCFFDNMQWMNEQGLTIYIKMPARALASRLESAKEVRPVLQNHKGEALVAFIGDKLTEREPYYAKALLCIDGIGLTPAKLDEAVKALSM